MVRDDRQIAGFLDKGEMMKISELIAKELEIKVTQVEAVIQLMDEGNTIPFIARYRKEVHGSLDDEKLRQLEDRLNYLRNLEDRKETILKSIESQGLLTDELRKQIDESLTLVELEDIYLPYKPKKRTRGMIAKEKGLEPFARLIFDGEVHQNIWDLALTYVNEDLGVASAEEALEGAKDIICEWMSERADIRSYIRQITFRKSMIQTEYGKEEDVSGVYEMYREYTELANKIPGHRILAINRGEKEKILKVKLEAPEEDIYQFLHHIFKSQMNEWTMMTWKEVIEDSYQRLIAPSIEREIRSQLTEAAQEGAIAIFKKNLRQLLMQSPLMDKVVLGWDPAFRTGCKLAIVDKTGKVLHTQVIYPTKPQEKIKESIAQIQKLASQYGVDVISLGNGTASRESEQVIAKMNQEAKIKIPYVIVSEAGASVYSASKMATEEFPNFDVGQRSAASIARRLQDPLSELVKIEPKSIGVGQYQHDMNQKYLSASLENTVEDCVNQVGVDVNTASYALLEYVSGISKTIAKNIVNFRDENGPFQSRKELLKVPKLGPKTYEQCVGFLRIFDGIEPLDMTGVHPESYPVARYILEKTGYTREDLKENKIHSLLKSIHLSEVALEQNVGEETLKDIVAELEKPGRDPRTESEKPLLRQDVLELENLKEGMVLTGTIRNVIDFGAFVDIGVHQDGLIHISKLSKKFIKHPLEAVSIGDIVEVRVIQLDIKRKRIGLELVSKLKAGSQWK